MNDNNTTFVINSKLQGLPRELIWQQIDKSLIPRLPGVYIYRDQKNQIIYVGKAINLYHRVASYFSKNIDNPKTAVLVENIRSCQTIAVSSELEALLLEANLIKKHKPLFNIKLTDDKDYLYIKISNHAFPEIVTARKSELTDSLDYFGPFPSAAIVRSTLKKLRRIFPWCSNPPHQIDYNSIPVERLRPCFYYHLHLCLGPCAGQITHQEYIRLIQKFRQFMNGDKEGLVSNLEKEMKHYAGEQRFEEAEKVKKMIEGVNYLTQQSSAQVYLTNPNFLEDVTQQSLEKLQTDLKLKNRPVRIECYDISNLAGQDAVGSLVVLTDGDYDKKWYRRFKIRQDGKPNDVAMLTEMISRRVKHQEWPIPDLMIMDGGQGQVNAASVVIKQYGWQIPVFGLAKRNEWLYSPDGQIIKLSRQSLSLRVVQKIRDEAHRFAINYHQKLRRNARLQNSFSF